MAAPTPLLQTSRLTVSIGQRIFCRDLDLSLHAGERLAILGRNGAGKSTLLSVLAGLRAPQHGEVRLKGASYVELGPRQSALIRGWLPQSRGDAFASTVLETALVGRHPHLDRWGWESEKDARIVRAALAAVDLAALEQRIAERCLGYPVPRPELVDAVLDYLQREYERELVQVHWAPRVNVTARTGWHIDRLLPAVRSALEGWETRVGTGVAASPAVDFDSEQGRDADRTA